MYDFLVEVGRFDDISEALKKEFGVPLQPGPQVKIEAKAEQKKKKRKLFG